MPPYDTFQVTTQDVDQVTIQDAVDDDPEHDDTLGSWLNGYRNLTETEWQAIAESSE